MFLVPFFLGFGLGAFASPRRYGYYGPLYAYPVTYAAYPYRGWY